MNINNWIKKQGIKSSLIKVNHNPNMNMPGWVANHFEVTLTLGDKKMYFFFSQGVGIVGKPKLLDIMNSLIVDAQSVISQDFDDWANDFGVDTTVEQLKIYNELKGFNRKLKDFLGHELFAEAMDLEEDHYDI